MSRRHACSHAATTRSAFFPDTLILRERLYIREHHYLLGHGAGRGPVRQGDVLHGSRLRRQQNVPEAGRAGAGLCDPPEIQPQAPLLRQMDGSHGITQPQERLKRMFFTKAKTMRHAFPMSRYILQRPERTFIWCGFTGLRSIP